jgi:hypothetical protein
MFRVPETSGRQAKGWPSLKWQPEPRTEHPGSGQEPKHPGSVPEPKHPGSGQVGRNTSTNTHTETSLSEKKLMT